MQVEQISPISFGIRPTLKVSKKNSKLLNKVADKFDVLNKELDNSVKKRIREDTKYEIEENNDILTFSQGGYCEHYIKFTKGFLNQPAEAIAQVLAKAAKIFSYDDILFEKMGKCLNMIEDRKYFEPPAYDFQDHVWRAYEEHVVPAIKKEFDKDIRFSFAEDIYV